MIEHSQSAYFAVIYVFVESSQVHDSQKSERFYGCSLDMDSLQILRLGRSFLSRPIAFFFLNAQNKTSIAFPNNTGGKNMKYVNFSV